MEVLCVVHLRRLDTMNGAGKNKNRGASPKVERCCVEFGAPFRADKWEELIAEAMPAASVFIDIGMNKGYSSANFFALWASELRFNPQRVHDVLKSEESLASVWQR